VRENKGIFQSSSPMPSPPRDLERGVHFGSGRPNWLIGCRLCLNTGGAELSGGWKGGG
jgi:hypothetical protein